MMDKIDISKIKTMLENKRVRLYLIVNIIVQALLICVFCKFNYGVLKCTRYLIIVEALFWVAWIDYYKKLIYNSHLLVLLFIRTIILIIEWMVNSIYGIAIVTSAITGLVIGFSIFGICYLVSRGGIGAGDVKLAAVLGYYLGSSAIMMTLLIIAFAAACFCIIRLILKKTTLKEEVPFGPFVLVGTIIALLIGV